MWLMLDLDGIVLRLQIRNYVKVAADDWDSTWCKTDFSFVSEPWLNYHKEDDEVFLAREIDDLKEALQALVNNQLTEVTEFSCIEPDFNFILNPQRDLRLDPKVLYVRPGCEIADIDAEWKISFWHDGLTANYLSVSLGREDIESLLSYLRLITGELRESDQQIQQLIRDGILR